MEFAVTQIKSVTLEFAKKNKSLGNNVGCVFYSNNITC